MQKYEENIYIYFPSPGKDVGELHNLRYFAAPSNFMTF